MTKSENLKATVFIPTWFGEDYLDELLKMVFKQKVDFNYEVLIYDTSSTDKTPSIIRKYAKKYKNLRYKIITKSEYGHGKTRREAAFDAKGEIVVYLSQDAVPSHDKWLYEMIKPFSISDNIAGVMGKQIPRPKCVPLLKNEIISVFRNFGPDDGTTIYYNDYFIKSQAQYDFITFYSDVNSAARKSVLTGDTPYKEVAYAEDQILGRDLIDNGYQKAYASRGSVFHSNDIKLRDYRARLFDETLGLRKSGVPVEKPKVKTVIKMIFVGVLRDWVSTIRDKDYSLKRKIMWLFLNPFYHIEKWRGVRLGASLEMNDSELLEKHSLEYKRERHKRKEG